MCRTIPAKIIEMKGDKAIADFGKYKKEVLVPLENVKVGDSVRCFGGVVVEIERVPPH